jgi:hypothetical protein
MTEQKNIKSTYKRILKWSGITFLLLIIFIIAAPFLFKDKIVSYVKQLANENLNAKVDFGDFDLTLFSSFPDFTLSINDVSIANIAPFNGDTLFSTKNLTATINLMSVINGDEYKIRTISLTKPRINAKVMQNGKTNWDIAKPSADTSRTLPVDTTAPPTKFKMKLKKLEIIDASIIYNDAASAIFTSLIDFDYNLSGDFTQDNFLLETTASIKEFTMAYGGTAYLNKVKTDIKISLDADMPNMKFIFKENTIALNELSFGIDGLFAMPGNDMNMDMKFKATQTEFKNFLSLIPAAYTKDFASVKTAGKLGIDGYVKGTYNDKKMPAFGTHIKIDDAMFQYPSLPAAANDITVDLAVDNQTGDPDATVIDLKKFHLSMAGNPVDMTMHVETPVSDPNLNGKILGRVDLASLKNVIPMEKGDELNGNITADVALNGRMSYIDKGMYDKFMAKGQVIVKDMNYKGNSSTYDMLIKSMTLNFSPQFVELSGFDSKIGKSDIQANGKIENFMQYFFKDELLKGNFAMKSSQMDLNEFMTSSDPNSADPNQAPTAPADTTAVSVIDVPGNIDFVMTTAIGKLIYDKIEMTDVSGGATIKDKKVDLSNLKMKLLGGAMVMNGFYDTKDINVPAINFDLNISDFDIPSTYKYLNTVQKLAPVAQYTTGRFSTKVKLNSALDNKMMPVMNSLNGEGDLQTKQVTVSGFEPLKKLADELKMEKFKKVDFSDLNIHYTFKDGKVSADEFPFKSGSIAGFVKGSTGFDQSIDYIMKMEVPTKDMPSGAKQYVSGLLSKANMLGVNAQMPEKVKLNALFGGTVTNPTVKTDVKEIAANAVNNVKEQVKEKIEEKKEEVKQEIKKNVEEEKKKILADAQKQADKIKEDARKLSEQTKKEGYAKADELEKKGANPLEKVANKKLAEKLRKETDEKAAKIVTEGDAKANGIMKTAQEQADKIK